MLEYWYVKRGVLVVLKVLNPAGQSKNYTAYTQGTNQN